MSITLEEDVVPGLGPDGRPDPEYPRSLGIIPAPFGLRSLAFAIDAAFVLLLTLPLTLGTFPLWMRAGSELLEQPTNLFSNDDFVAGLIFYAIGQGLLNVFLLVQLILHGRRGVTAGKAMVGIRSVNVVHFTKPGFWRVVLRGIVFWAALAIVPIIGAIPFLLSPLWDGEKRGRGWLDKIGRNWLVDARRGLDPFDVKAMRQARRQLTKPQLSADEQLRSLATGVSGAVPEYVPAGRSRSGVISARPFDGDDADAWQPPEIAESAANLPMQSVAPAASSTAAPPAAPSAPAPPAAVSSPAAPSRVVTRPAAIFTFDDGTSMAVTGSGLLGRAPQPRDGENIDHLIPVSDESRLISKTHAGFAVDTAGCWFVDRASVNGVTVTEPNGQPVDLTVWERHLVPWGSTVALGGRNITITPDSTTNR